MTAHEEIAAVVYRYARAVDDAEPATLAGCFTEDATLFATIQGVGEQSYSGRDDIGQTMTARRLEAVGDARRHLVTNLVVSELTATSARVNSYVSVVITVDGQASVRCTGTYDMTLRAEPSGWLIDRAFVALDGMY